MSKQTNDQSSNESDSKKSPVSKHQNMDNPKEPLNENRNNPVITTKKEASRFRGYYSKRRVKDFIFEFIMIFVAITGGFFMDNLRERVVEHRKEKEYIERLVIDLNEDTTNLKILMRQNREQMEMLDSLVNMLEKPISNIDIQFITLLADNLNNSHLFTPRDVTMSQLKNTGELRLVEESKVSESIVSYYSYIESVNHDLGNANSKFVDDSFKEEMTFINFNQIFKDKELKINNANKMTLENRCFIYKIQVRAYFSCLEKIYEQGASLIKYLKKEYSLKADEPSI